MFNLLMILMQIKEEKPDIYRKKNTVFYKYSR